MWYPRPAFAVAMAVAAACTMASCTKDQEEADKFPRLDTEARSTAPFSELKHFELANGIQVFLQEEHTDNRVAIEVFYPAGFFYEPDGLPNIAHLTEHMCVHAATASYQPDEALNTVLKSGLVDAEALGTAAHFDYVVPVEELDTTLNIEAERLTSVRFHKDVIATESEKAASEGLESLKQGRSLLKYGMMSLNQVMRYGNTTIDLLGGVKKITPEQLQQFHDSRYCTDNMIIVMIGGFEMDAAEALVRKHFEGIAAKKSPELPPMVLASDKTVNWDLSADAMFFVFPGDSTDYKERIALTMFGNFLKVAMEQNQELQQASSTKYCSNPVYPVGTIPLFVYVEPSSKQKYSTAREDVLRIIDQAAGTISERRLMNMKEAINAFVTESMIHKDAYNYRVPHHQVIGQEALNVGIKYILKEGRSNEEFTSTVDSITLEYLQQTLNKYISMTNLREVRLTG